jgi:hypothetical protein
VHVVQQLLLVDGKHGDVVAECAHALGDGLIGRTGLPPGERREHGLGLAGRWHQFGDRCGQVEHQVALGATVVVMADPPRDTGELAGPVLDHAQLGHQRALTVDLVREFVHVAVAVVERLPAVHGLPFDPDLVVLVDTARRSERLGNGIPAGSARPATAYGRATT